MTDKLRTSSLFTPDQLTAVHKAMDSLGITRRANFIRLAIANAILLYNDGKFNIIDNMRFESVYPSYEGEVDIFKNCNITVSLRLEQKEQLSKFSQLVGLNSSKDAGRLLRIVVGVAVDMVNQGTFNHTELIKYDFKFPSIGVVAN